MKLVKTTEAVGQVLCHDITQIIPGVKKDAVFRKGHIITEEDIPVLLNVGKDMIYIWENDETMLHEVCVDQGEMLTEAPVYKVPEHKIPVRKNENKKAEVVRSGRKEKKVTAVKTSGEEKNSYEDPFVGMNSREIEEEMRRMDEEDLNLNFGDF